MENDIVCDIVSMKSITTLNLSEDIKTWIRSEPGRSEREFARLAGISHRTLQYITNYKGGANEPNWTRTTLQGIMKVLECEAIYTPVHKIK